MQELKKGNRQKQRKERNFNRDRPIKTILPQLQCRKKGTLDRGSNFRFPLKENLWILIQPHFWDYIVQDSLYTTRTSAARFLYEQIHYKSQHFYHA